MTRHELKDGCWYLIKQNRMIGDAAWMLGKYKKDNDWFACLPGYNIVLIEDLDDGDGWVGVDPDNVFELAINGVFKLDKDKEKEIFDCFLKIRKGIGNQASSLIDSASSKTLRLAIRNNFNLHYSANEIRAIREKIRSRLGKTSLSDYLNMINIGSLPYPYMAKEVDK